MLTLGKILLVLRVPGLFQSRQRCAKRFYAVNRTGVKLVEGMNDSLEKHTEFKAELVVVLKAALRCALHQLAARMPFVAEKADVHHRQTQQRRLQGHNGFAHWRQQARVLRNLTDELFDDVQPQHLTYIFSFLFKLGTHQATSPGSAVGPPHFLAKWA